MTALREPAIVIGEEIPGYDVEVTPELVENHQIYVARHPELPRCMSQGDTPEEAIESLNEVREAYMADMRRAGLPVPEPKMQPDVRILRFAAEGRPREEALPVGWRVTKGVARIVQW